MVREGSSSYQKVGDMNQLKPHSTATDSDSVQKNLSNARKASSYPIVDETNTLELAKSVSETDSVFMNTHLELRKSKSEVLLEIQESPFEPDSSSQSFRARSLDSDACTRLKRKSRSFDSLSDNSGAGFTGFLLPSEIELSEYYTCVTVHGPNRKVTHIFGDHILEQHKDGYLTKFAKKNGEAVATPDAICPAGGAVGCFPSEDVSKF